MLTLSIAAGRLEDVQKTSYVGIVATRRRWDETGYKESFAD